jgi:hypothetical protein
MNLALIDPFQLAQDSPDALTNDLRRLESPRNDISTHVFQTAATQPHCASIARAITWHRGAQMAKLLSGMFMFGRWHVADAPNVVVGIWRRAV